MDDADSTAAIAAAAVARDMASAWLGSCKPAALGGASKVSESCFVGQEMRRENVAGFPSLSISVRVIVIDHWRLSEMIGGSLEVVALLA